MSTSAIIPAPAPAGGLVLKVEEARELLREATKVDEVKGLHDKAKALEGYYRKQGAALEAQQDAGVVALMAGRRIGELLEEQVERGERQGRGDAGRAAANAPKARPGPLAEPTQAPAAPPTLKELGIERHQAQNFQRLAKVPEEKFDKYVQAARESRTEITQAGLLNHASRRNPHAASNVNDGEPDKNDKFTPPWLVKWLVERFGVNWDFSGHPAAPATAIIGKKRIWTIEDDCLTQDWADLVGLGNWEWDKLNLFVPFAFMQIATGAGRGVAQPMPSTRTEQRFWQEFIEPFRPDCGGRGAEVRFVRGPDQARARYGTVLDPEGLRPDNSPGMPTAVVIFHGPFQRSPDVPPQGTIAEVLEEMRFGDDVRLTNLWRKVLPLARGDAGPPLLREHVGEAPPNLDRRTAGGARRALLEAAEPKLTEDAVTYEWCQGRSTRDLVHAFAFDSPETLSRCGDVRRGAMQMVNIRGAPPHICPACRAGVDADVEEGSAIDGLKLRRSKPPPEDMPVDRFRGEAEQLGYSARVYSQGKELQLRCCTKKCPVAGGERFAFALTADGARVERSAGQLQRLREHARAHEKRVKPSPSKKKGRKR